MRWEEKHDKSNNLEDKFRKFDELWSPKVISRVDNYDVKIVKVKGELVWLTIKTKMNCFI